MCLHVISVITIKCIGSTSYHSLWLVSRYHPCKPDTNFTSVVTLLRLWYEWLTRELLVRVQLWNTFSWIWGALTRQAHRHFPMHKWSWHPSKHGPALHDLILDWHFFFWFFFNSREAYLRKTWEHKGHFCSIQQPKCWKNVEHASHKNNIQTHVHMLHKTWPYHWIDVASLVHWFNFVFTSKVDFKGFFKILSTQCCVFFFFHLKRILN